MRRTNPDDNLIEDDPFICALTQKEYYHAEEERQAAKAKAEEVRQVQEPSKRDTDRAPGVSTGMYVLYVRQSGLIVSAEARVR